MSLGSGGSRTRFADAQDLAQDGGIGRGGIAQFRPVGSVAAFDHVVNGRGAEVSVIQMSMFHVGPVVRPPAMIDKPQR
jgi:hypothetical protein